MHLFIYIILPLFAIVNICKLRLDSKTQGRIKLDIAPAMLYNDYMARKARVKSESGMYHIVLKGNDKLLFAEDDDYRRFLRLLAKSQERDLTEIYAYCLFSESAHLVLKEGLQPIGETLKALISAYAVICNEKYNRSGKLFYDRYVSEPIETDEELADAVRYVFRLPLKYGLTAEYEYSSYNNYMSRKGIRSDSLMLLFDDSIMQFKSEMQTEPARKFASGERKKTITDNEVIELVRTRTRGMTPYEAEHITLPVLGELVYNLQREGSSIRQLSRVLDISKSTVERALKVYAESTEL